MPDDAPKLSPVTADEIARALSFALRFNGRKRFDKGDELMARITAEHSVRISTRRGSS